jgi:retinol dehydrogenase-12
VKSLDPGNLKTDLYNQVPWWQMLVINFVLKEPIYGAYTELYGGLSEDIKMENNGTFGQS